MRINNNITALNAHRQYGINNSNISKSVEKLSSGYRINRAGDDAAGLAISEKMRAQIRGLTMASKNSQDAISLVQTAEGALQESHNILQRMRELAVQSASDTNETSVDRDALNKEYQELIKELDDTAAKTKFNDMGLIDGSFASKVTTARSTDFDASWASTSTVTGAHEIVASVKLSQAEILGVEGTYAEGTGSSAVKITSTKGDVAIAYNPPAPGDGAKSDTINGTWNLNFANGKFTATNSATGEVRVALAMAIENSAGTNVGTIDFGDLGTFTITNSHADQDVAASDFQGFSGTVTVSGSIAPKEAQYTHYATLNGEEVELQTGMKTLVFKNSGISVNLANSLNVDKLSNVTMDAAGGTVNVERTGYNPMVIQTGANQGDELGINIEKMDAYSLGVRTSNIASRLDASASITQVNTAINSVSTQRASLGALQNRLNHKIANLDTSAENLQAAESRIRDVDMAKEMTTFTRNNILFQASTAMLAQANALPQGVLQLLG